MSSVRQDLLELTLLFLAFYLPGLLFVQQSLQRASQELGLYMAQSILVALPQLLLFLYVLWLRERPAGEPTGGEPAGGEPTGQPEAKASPWTHFGLGRFRGRHLLQGLLLFGGIAALLLILGLIASLVPPGGRELLRGGFRWQLRDWRLLPLVLVFGVVTGYREELFFRGYMITRLCDLGAPGAAAVAASSLLFAAGHLYQGVSGLAVALALGVYFGVFFLRRRDVHRLALAHALYNTAILVASLWLGPEMPPP
jgi:membrane protease YdiL (CAAX protease family)